MIQSRNQTGSWGAVLIIYCLHQATWCTAPVWALSPSNCTSDMSNSGQHWVEAHQRWFCAALMSDQWLSKCETHSHWPHGCVQRQYASVAAVFYYSEKKLSPSLCQTVTEWSRGPPSGTGALEHARVYGYLLCDRAVEKHFWWRQDRSLLCTSMFTGLMKPSFGPGSSRTKGRSSYFSISRGIINHIHS